VIFHTKYPKKFRAFLRSAQFFKVRPPIAWNPGSALDLYIQVERSLYCIYRRRIRIHVSIYIYTVDLQLETITQILLRKRQPGYSVKKSIYKCEIKDGKNWCWSTVSWRLI
jgi:hypothetical protein